ncbi:MAG TPA: hypothetical protein VHY20_01715, partial [Pirellulales bacterium]|nr:hypothetical protein [Pirellulales bacterium]
MCWQVPPNARKKSQIKTFFFRSKNAHSWMGRVGVIAGGKPGRKHPPGAVRKECLFLTAPVFSIKHLPTNWNSGSFNQGQTTKAKQRKISIVQEVPTETR